MNQLGALVDIPEMIEDIASFNTKMVLGPIGVLPDAWKYLGKPAATAAVKAVLDANSAAEPKNQWAQPATPKDDNTMLWVLAAVAATGIVIAIFRK